MNNRLENLRFLCPNCHRQQPTSCRVKKYYKASDEELINSFRKNSPRNVRQLLLSVNMSDRSTNYLWAYEILEKNGIPEWKEKNSMSNKAYSVRLRTRKFEHPDKNTLKDMLENFPIETIGKKYNVSGNAIKKICKKYQLNTKPRGYWQKRLAKCSCNGTGYEPECA